MLGISLIEEHSGHENEKTCVSTPGVRHAYTVSMPTCENNSEEEQTVPTGLSLEELMAEMKSI